MKHINILNAISTFDEYHTSVILTYGANLAFYEQGVLSRFWSANCRNNLVFMDANRYQETVAEAGGALGYIGRRYLVTPIKIGSRQAFHAKIILLLGSERARLFVGSGNLTFHGYGDNLEVFTQFDWSGDAPEGLGIFLDVWNLILSIQKRWGRFEQAGFMLDQAFRKSPWLNSSTPGADSRLVSSLDKPLLEQLREYIGKQRIERITILSPFLDRKAKAVENLYQRFKPRKISLLLQDKKTSGDPHALNQLRKASLPLSFYSFDEPSRYVHAKVYAFENKNETILAIGSANCTQAGLLADSSTGNFETLLLQRYATPERLEALLAGFVSLQPIDLDDSLTLRPVTSQDQDESLPVDFQEIVLDGRTIAGKFFVHALPRKSTSLVLAFSLQKELVIALDGCDVGANKFKVTLEDREAHLLGDGICAVAIYGNNTKTNKRFLLSRALWLTNIEALNRLPIFLTLNDERAGRLLSEMYLGSDEDWRDLYNTLTTFIEFEIEKIKSTRPISRPKRNEANPTNDEAGQENVLRVVDRQIAKEELDIQADEVGVIQEGALSSWLKIVFTQFPVGKHPDASPTALPEPVRQQRRKPNQTMGGRFVKLVRRYIRSLKNQDFTYETPPYHLISYFSIFSKIVWLLYQHHVIDKNKLADLITDMHIGFFGEVGDGLIPFATEELRNHLTWRYEPYWRDSLAHLYALAGLITVQDQLPDEADRFTQVLACVFSFVKPTEILDDQSGLAQIATSYSASQESLERKLTQIMRNHLLTAQERLDSWSATTVVALKDSEGDEQKAYLSALISIGIASERIAEYRNDIDQQINYCADLTFWAGRLDLSGLSSVYQTKLVELHKAKGDLRAVIHALIEKGSEYRLAGEMTEAVKTLIQAQSLARELKDPSLMRQIDIFLSAAKFLS